MRPLLSQFAATASSKLGWLHDNSRYAPIRQGIEARANASQDKPTPAAEFAEAWAANPPPVWRYGNDSRLLPFVRRRLPRKRRERILARRFRLHKLGS